MDMHISEEKLKSILIESGLINENDFSLAYEESKRSGQTITNVLIGNEKISEDEREKRAKLKQVPAKSTIRRLPEGLIYEIETPGVSVKKDITFTKLEQSLELKAYSKDKCYVKKLPAKVEILGMAIKGDKIFLRLKG